MLKPEPIGLTAALWGEGPIWHDDHLLWVDIEGHTVHRYDPKTGTEMDFPVGERVGTVVPSADGRLVIAGDTGFHFLDPASGKVTPIADPEPDIADNRFNDGKCDPSGRFWAGTISLTKKEGSAALYRLDPDLSVHKMFSGVTTSNGIVWSADAETMFYIDTPRREVLAFDFDNQTGAIANCRTVIDTGHIDASPDGMAIDANGNLWVAFCHGAAVRCYDPSSGAELECIDFPVVEVTACAFGGDDLGDLYVTTGKHKTLEEADAGRLFVVRPGVTGVKSSVFAGS